jgi:predicted AAA+ superfamily ATPase
MVHRIIKDQLINSIIPGNVTVLFGARRTGKTVLMKEVKNELPGKKILLLNGEDYDVARLLSSRSEAILKNLVSGYNCLFIDEAQNIPEIGANLKLLVDTLPELSVFVTGSASFDLRNKIGEPLTGRSQFFILYPFSLAELPDDYITNERRLPSLLVYGCYPQVFNTENDLKKKQLLENIRNGYLLKDILQLDNIKDSLFVMTLLRLIAFQIGNDVSLNELASSLGTTVKTVQRYLDLLEKTYIIFRLYGFSRNLRKEISKSPRFYFWDNGIRNSIISGFNPLDLRDDTGKLWENFCISERLKKQQYNQVFANHYFWRTYDQQEIDLIEEINSVPKGYEFKWGEKVVNPPKAFRISYPEAEFQTINRLNYYNFLK